MTTTYFQALLCNVIYDVLVDIATGNYGWWQTYSRAAPVTVEIKTPALKRSSLCIRR